MVELLRHHVKPYDGSFREFGVFDAWADMGLKPTMRAVQREVIPHLKKKVDENGNPVYPFLTKNLKQKHEFTKRWLECYLAYLKREFTEIPDFDPETGRHNKDYLCQECPNWDLLCSFKREKGRRVLDRPAQSPLIYI